MCKDRDSLWEELQNEGADVSRDEFEHNCDVRDYGADESLNDDCD